MGSCQRPDATRSRAARWVAWIAISVACFAPAASRSAELACHRGAIVVTGDNADDLPLACAAVEHALVFLEPSGLTLERGPAIRLVEALPAGNDQHTLGLYDAKRDVVDVLNFRAAVAASECGPRAFKVPMSEPLWQSYIAHEIAHAAARAHDPLRRLSLAQHEYIAAVVQLGTLPQAIRETILHNYAGIPAFVDPSEITDLYYYMAPCAFAVKAYRHYLEAGNGPAFISRMLATGGRP
jgi:hypothetical protein